MTRLIAGSPALFFLGIMWLVFLVDVFLPWFHMAQFGIRPRQLNGLFGLVAAPFIHGSWSHLMSNTVPLVVLPFVARLAISQKAILSILILGGLGSGIGVWLFSLGGVVVGASGVVFTWIGFLCARAYFVPNLLHIGLCIFVFALYGGAVASLLSVLPSISWAAHFWGFVTGIFIARHFDTFSRQTN